MFERVAHSCTASRQRIARETFIEALDFAAREQFGHDCETLLFYLSQLHLRFAPSLNLVLAASNADEDDADEN
jgi:hypothetical protein